MYKILKTIQQVIANCILTLGVIILVSAVVLTVMHLKPAVVVSGSMEPVIHTGSMILIDKTYRDVKKRDIIAFETGGVLVTHRVVEVSNKGYVTKGDANDKPDPGILKGKDLYGRVVVWIPKVGYIIKPMTSMTGKVILVTMCMGVLLLYIVGLKEERADDREKNTDSIDSPVS